MMPLLWESITAVTVRTHTNSIYMPQLFGDPLVPTWKGGPQDWYRNVGNEMQVTWGLHPMFQLELPELRFMRGQTIWLEGTLDDLRERRNAVLGMARSVIGNDLSGELEALWPMIAVDTISPRLANAICHAYVNPPVRTFNQDDAINDGFDDLYETLGVNEVMDAAYRAALFTNTVLIYWNGESFDVLTPEYFRICEDMDGKPELWLCRREKDGIRFEVWNDTVCTTRLGSNSSVVKTVANPYGGFPGVLFRLTPSQDTYGAGITEAADLNAASNLITLFANRVALYQGFSIGVATNFGDSVKAGQKVSPGSVLTPKNQGGDSSTAPKFEFVTPDGKFKELSEFRDARIASFQKNQELPGFLVDETAVPPTGVALQVAERQINAKRRRHQNSLRTLERGMAKFVSMLAQKAGRELLVVDKFSVKFGEPEMFNTPEESLAYDIQLASVGGISPSAFVQKYYGIQRGMTDAKAVEMLKANQSLFSFLPTPTSNPNASTP